LLPNDYAERKLKDMATQRVTAQIEEPPYGLNRLPHLGSSLLQVLIPQEVQSMWKEKAWQTGAGRSARTLVKYPDLRIVLVSMEDWKPFPAAQDPALGLPSLRSRVMYAYTSPTQGWKCPGENCWRSTATYLTMSRQFGKARSY
jgi:hypothetical protein